MTRRTTYNAASATLPLLLNTPEFRAAWADWCADRAERGKPMTLRAATIALRRCEALGSAAAVAAIEHSIAAGYQGIYEDPTFARRKGATNTAAPREAAPEPQWAIERRQREAEAKLVAARREIYDLTHPGGLPSAWDDLSASRRARVQILRAQIAKLTEDAQ